GQRLGLALGQDLERIGAHRDAVAGDLHLLVEGAVGGVVLEQVGVDLGRGEVVDRYQVDVGPRLAGRPIEVAADAPEAVDPYPYCHLTRLPASTRPVLPRAHAKPDRPGQPPAGRG